jgi:hypothetical protein
MMVILQAPHCLPTAVNVLLEGTQDFTSIEPCQGPGANVFVTIVPGVPTYSLAPSNLPTSAAPTGIPASSTFVDTVQKVEMADFQMFTDVAIDTGDETTRRLFLTADGLPADPTDAVALLGTPVVSFLNQTQWFGGINGGTAGNFNPTGTINPFLPGPAIGN